MTEHFGVSVMTSEPTLMRAMDRQTVLRRLNQVTKEKRATSRISLSRLLLTLEENSLTKRATRMGVSEEIIRRTTQLDARQNDRIRAVIGFYADQYASKATA